MYMLTLQDPQTTIAEITSFVSATYRKQGKFNAVIAVSGGIDSAVALSILTLSVPNKDIYPILLPYGQQDMSDAQEIVRWNKIPEENVTTIDIQPMVDLITQTVSTDKSLQFSGMPESDDDVLSKERKGNIMARVRMIAIYDLAKAKDALVCGTENKSEKLLGYFTRYGDEASDLEPIQHLYKTQVRQVVEHLGLPDIFLHKKPTAGLWEGQTDESELGFSYADADKVLFQYVEDKKKLSEISDVDPAIAKKIIDRVEANEYKHNVPYVLDVS